jgi:hypothetical protein
VTRRLTDEDLDGLARHAEEPGGQLAGIMKHTLRDLVAEVKAYRARAAREPGLTPLDDAETTEAMLESEVARLRVAVEAAADGLRSAAVYLRHANAFAFAEQVEIDEKRARTAVAAPSPSGTVHVDDDRGER